MTKSGIGYFGQATIKILRGRRVVRTITQHNAGTEWLFKLLASVLCGNNESANMPKFLDVFSVSADSEELKDSSVLVYRIPLTNKVLDAADYTISPTASKYGASFTAFIPANAIKSGSLGSTTFKSLAIYGESSGEESKLASINLKEHVSIQSSDKYNIMIDWTMVFSNIQVVESQG